MRKLFAAVAGVAAALSMQVAPAFAEHDGYPHAGFENMSLVANYDEDGTFRTGTDMAFWGDTLLLGNLDQGNAGVNATPPGGFRVMDISDPANPRKVGHHVCSGDQSDVSVWEDIVIVSVDKPTNADCELGAHENWEGIRIVSLDRVRGAAPEAIGEEAVLATVETDCGSHTNTIYPDLENNRLLVYVLSYPLAGRYNPAGVLPKCNVVTHRKITVVEVPLDDPGNPTILGTPSTGMTIGCHDVTVFLERQIAAAACLTESQIWDLSNPEEPQIIASIRDPRINIHHSTTFSNDGNTLVIGDELGGAAMSPGCIDDQAYPHGGLFFYDVTDAEAPEFRSSFKIPQRVVSEFCTAHQFNVIPRHDEKNVLVSSWYAGSTSVIDFTDPSQPEQIAYYIPAETKSPDTQPTEAAAWSSYWYNGHIYASNFDEDVNSVTPGEDGIGQSRGLDVFSLDIPEATDGAVTLPWLNPQLQEPLPTGGGGGGEVAAPGKSGNTPAGEKRKGGPKR